jgi:hypothetical protein
MESRPEVEPHYEQLSPGKRGLLIALLYYLKDHLGLELQDIAAPARSTTIHDYCRRSAPKAEISIFRGVYRTAHANVEAMSPWALAAFTELFGEDVDAPKPNMAAALSQLFPHSITDQSTLERIADAHAGVYAIYRYPLQDSKVADEAKSDGEFYFERSRLEIRRSPAVAGLEFQLTHLVESYGRTPLEASSFGGFIIASQARLYLHGVSSDFPEYGVIVLPCYSRQMPSFMGMMLRGQTGEGFFASRILAIKAKIGQEDGDAFEPRYVGLNQLPLGEANAQRLRNSAKYDGRSSLTFIE